MGEEQGTPALVWEQTTMMIETAAVLLVAATEVLLLAARVLQQVLGQWERGVTGHAWAPMDLIPMATIVLVTVVVVGLG
jgi:hypothetical protein